MPIGNLYAQLHHKVQTEYKVRKKQRKLKKLVEFIRSKKCEPYDESCG